MKKYTNTDVTIFGVMLILFFMGILYLGTAPYRIAATTPAYSWALYQESVEFENNLYQTNLALENARHAKQRGIDYGTNK